jgi:hypothetical protein
VNAGLPFAGWPAKFKNKKTDPMIPGGFFGERMPLDKKIPRRYK